MNVAIHTLGDEFSSPKRYGMGTYIKCSITRRLVPPRVEASDSSAQIGPALVAGRFARDVLGDAIVDTINGLDEVEVELLVKLENRRVRRGKRELVANDGGSKVPREKRTKRQDQ